MCSKERRGVYRVLVGKPEGKSRFGRPKLKWEDNIEMDLQEVELRGGGMDWIDVAENRHRRQALVNAAMYFRVP